uniref:TAZ-type domain-containing protein n=1 Tax=Parascaris equorum TaxID=6256 RepID=A0A914RP28_PAREQ
MSEHNENSTEKKIQKAIYNSTADEMFAKILNQFSFLCVASKCRSDCRNCEQCQYALNQIRKMQCPKMEQCSLNCMKKNCNAHCFDGDCPQCARVAKRIFLHMCREHDVPHLPLVSYSGNCMALFDVVVKNYIKERSVNILEELFTAPFLRVILTGSCRLSPWLDNAFQFCFILKV